MSNTTPEPEPTRFTLRAAPGYAVSHFALGLMVLMADKTAKAGAPWYLFTSLATDSGVHVNTVLKLTKPESSFNASTLAALAQAVGHSRWETVTLLGQQVSELVEGKPIDRPTP